MAFLQGLLCPPSSITGASRQLDPTGDLPPSLRWGISSCDGVVSEPWETRRSSPFLPQPPLHSRILTCWHRGCLLRSLRICLALSQRLHSRVMPWVFLSVGQMSRPFLQKPSVLPGSSFCDFAGESGTTGGWARSKRMSMTFQEGRWGQHKGMCRAEEDEAGATRNHRCSLPFPTPLPTAQGLLSMSLRGR